MTNSWTWPRSEAVLLLVAFHRILQDWTYYLLLLCMMSVACTLCLDRRLIGRHRTFRYSLWTQSTNRHWSSNKGFYRSPIKVQSNYQSQTGPFYLCYKPNKSFRYKRYIRHVIFNMDYLFNPLSARVSTNFGY